ncbi:hypothetical protein M2352_004046 [Azospirillum fermentarium]|uniref:GNAT family N-acetyltransferase n=1 Tax=Azospirillum fermentarium TaxID=1233114 RepID=UPI00222753E8|nr:GNAT family N-acetyltransferase [Azospirillum fermentarium]MCW2248412.1 hypothetical protein [Azospirillum fermentarium]
MGHKTTDVSVTLAVAGEGDLPAFKRDLQEAFAVAVIEELGHDVTEPIPSDDDIERSFRAPGAVVYHILAQGQRVGGAVLTINEATQRNALDLFYVSRGRESRGLGAAAWAAIEQAYPDTRVWETHTPYFERRNIHFYVNKCGFKIVEYYNDRHPGPPMPDDEGMPGGGLFRFEKIMGETR